MPTNHTLTQELRLSNPADSRIIWTTGIYYFNSNFYQDFGSYSQHFGVPSPPAGMNFFFDQAYASSSAAVFGEVTYPISAALRLTGGVRESRDTVYHANFSSFPRPPGPNPDFFNKTFDHFDWKVRLEDDLTANNLLYGMVSTGDRPGGAANGLAYIPEVVTAFELGSKNRIGNMMTLNAAAFYYNYGGFQALSSCCFPAVRSVMVSVPAKFYGAEVEAAALLTPQDKLTFSANYVKAHFSGNGVGLDGTGALVPILTNGGVIPHTPDLSLNGSFAHTFSLTNGATITPLVDAHYQTKMITDFDYSVYGSTPDASFTQQPYTIVNASLTFTSDGGKYHITAYDNNLTDVIYKLGVNPGMGGNTASVNDPRTFGVIVSARF
jgi:iron complex outermembrane receptor protein